MSFQLKRLLAFLPGHDSDDLSNKKKLRKSVSSTRLDIEPVHSRHLHASARQQTNAPTVSQMADYQPSVLDTGQSEPDSVKTPPEYTDSADNYDICMSPVDEDTSMDWEIPLKIDTSQAAAAATPQEIQKTPTASSFPPELTASPVSTLETPVAPFQKGLPFRQPRTHRMPSQAISDHSESDESAPNTPSVIQGPPTHKGRFENSPLSHQTTSPEQTDVASFSSQDSNRHHRILPSFHLSHHLTPHSLHDAPLLTRSTSNQSQVSAPSTPTGFLQHRASTSQGVRPSEVKETLDAHIRHTSCASGNSDAASEMDEDDDEHESCFRLNQYTLGKTMGKGSAGIVKFARDDEGNQYAVKEFSKRMLRRRKKSEALKNRKRRIPLQQASIEEEDEEKRDALALIRAEVAVMKKLDHPNLVRLYEVLNVQESDSLYMVMELCGGGPLTHVFLPSKVDTAMLGHENQSMTHAREQTDKTVGRPMSEETARNYFRQIILGVEYLHANDIVHRDLKPENILLSTDRIVCKIVDFGVSEMFMKHGDDITTKTVGSPAFMSPEMCDTHVAGIHARATDIWAMGVTLYCIITGRLPFESANFLDLNELIKNADYFLPAGVSGPLRFLFSRILEKNPEKRITMDQLREDDWVTSSGTEPLPSKDDNLNIIEEPSHSDVQMALGSGRLWDAIASAVHASKVIKRIANTRKMQKRGMSLQSDNSEGERAMAAYKSYLNESGSNSASPACASPRPTSTHSMSKDQSVSTSSHGRHSSSLSVDDSFLDNVRYVENETGAEVIRRDNVLSRSKGPGQAK